jgi:GNAT superfamily N-acetyltransferase
MAPPKLTFKPVTEATWPDFEALFESPGAPKYCWCMVFRQIAEESRTITNERRKNQMRGRIMAKTPVGLIAYSEGEPVAWVSVAPKETFLRLGGPEPRAGEKVWSLTCMFMARRLRGQGLAHDLIDAAIEHARKEGATVLEAYPVEPASPSYRFMGFVPAFEARGFVPVGMAGTRRHVMRLPLTR